MKSNRQLWLGLAVGLIVGLCWRPYSFTLVKYGGNQAILKSNRLTGSAWLAEPGVMRWKPMEH